MEKQVQPGETVTLSLKASSKTLCAISGVDKAVTFLDRERAINLEKVFKQLEKFSVSPKHGNYFDYTVEECSESE